MKIILFLKGNVMICLKIVVPSCNNNKMKVVPMKLSQGYLWEPKKIDAQAWQHTEQEERSGF